MSTGERVRHTEAEYLHLERASPLRHELVNGELSAVAGGSPAHARVIGSVYAALHNQLRGTGCLPTTSDQRLCVVATGLYAYPDVSVYCGRPTRHTADANTLVNPSLLVEVLSPSTEAYDRGAKFAHYRQIPTLSAYVLVSPEARTLEAFERRDDGAWSIPAPVGVGGALHLTTMGLVLEADVVFEGVELFDAPA